MEERARRNVSAAICRLGGWQHNAARVLPEKQRIDDRVAELFVPVILIISLLTFFIWVFFGGIDVVSHGLFAALSVLVVACPCVVGLATPVALAAGLNKAARNHILIRDTSALEQMRNVDVVVFDKTGTLTEGHPTVIGWLWAQGRRSIIKMYCLLPSLLRTILWQKQSLRPWKGRSRLSLPTWTVLKTLPEKVSEWPIKVRNIGRKP